MVAEELDFERVAFAGEHGTKTQAHTHLVDARSQLADAEPGVKVWPAKRSRNLMQRGERRRILVVRQLCERALCFWPYDEPRRAWQAGRG